MKTHDVIVVGGSVAGAPTATWLARKGHRVLLVDRARFPRDTNSTHFVWPRGMSYLNRLGVAQRIIDCTPSYTNLEVSIEGISLRGHVPLQALRQRFERLHGNADGVVGYYSGPRRTFLDKLLLDHARDHGVEVHEEAPVEQVITGDDGRVCGVRVAGAQPFEARARVVVGADGRISQFAGHVGAKKVLAFEKSTFAYYGYFAGIAKEELAIHKRGRLGTAIFPTQDDRHLALVYGPTAWWADFSRDAEANFHRGYDYVAPEVAALVRRATRVEDFKAMGRMVAFHRELHGPGWVLVGDAASFKDQWTAMGITHALRDAELVSGYLDRYLKGEASWDDALSAYAQVRDADYHAYWRFVCDGAQMQPYTAQQLAWFHALQADGAHVDRFIAQVGDTVPFTDSIPVAVPAELPQFIRHFDAGRLGCDANPFTPAAQALAA
jgi:2-polyprenyl-6-methoxyphenol hydroxylase-like FAD-dependent oxidoreductase